MPVKVAGHRTDEVAAILLAGEGAELNTSDFGDGVSLVRDLEGASEQGRLADRLGRKLRVDTTRAEEKELRYAREARPLDDVRGHRQVVVEEVVGCRRIVVNATDARRRHDHIGRLFLGVECTDLGTIA